MIDQTLKCLKINVDFIKVICSALFMEKLKKFRQKFFKLHYWQTPKAFDFKPCEYFKPYVLLIEMKKVAIAIFR